MSLQRAITTIILFIIIIPKLKYNIMIIKLAYYKCCNSKTIYKNKQLKTKSQTAK